MYWEIFGKVVSKSWVDKIPEKIREDRVRREGSVIDEIYVRTKKHKDKVEEKMMNKKIFFKELKFMEVFENIIFKSNYFVEKLGV